MLYSLFDLDTVAEIPITSIGPSPFASHKTTSSYSSLSTATQGLSYVLLDVVMR